MIALIISIASGITAITPNPDPDSHEAILLAHKVLDAAALNVHHNAQDKQH